jgi:hypothetical protein
MMRFGSINLTVANIPTGSFFLHQILVNPRLPHLVRHATAPGHGCVHHSRGYTVDPDVLLAMVRGHGASHLYDCALGGRVQ